ncbi:MAG: DivIVA domain-containing protein [Acidimicrobiales bacterium]|nr:DivIVA domain-containing protein [Acidimicrobiales bacterium]MDG2218931.1 DivIVA domain-containing protein [Acidimicrobiales bacterium]
MDELPPLFQDIEFRVVWKGYDSDEVDAYVDRVAKAAAVVHGRVSELQQRAEAAENRATAESASSASSETEESLTRTLILAQRTADTAIAEAKAEAAELIASAEVQAQIALRDAEASAAVTIKNADDHASRVKAEAETDRRTLLAKAEAEATAASSYERENLAGEVAELERYSAFLVEDVALLERHLGEQRSLLATSVSALSDLVERPETFRVDKAPATSGVVPPEGNDIGLTEDVGLSESDETGVELDAVELADKVESLPETAEMESVAAASAEPEAFAPSVLGMPPVLAVDGDVEFVDVAPIEEPAAEPATESIDAVENDASWTAAVAAWDEPTFAPESDDLSQSMVDLVAIKETALEMPSTSFDTESPLPVFDPRDFPTGIDTSTSEPVTVSAKIDDVALPLLVTAADFEPLGDDEVIPGEIRSDEPTAPIPVVEDVLFADPIDESSDPFLDQLRDAVAFDEVELGDDALAAFFDHDDDAASRGWFGRKR